MHRLFASLILLVATFVIVPLPASAQVTIAWSYVGNPDNAPDPETGFGAVPYSYNIGTYDVTNNQYVAFLNSNDPTGANSLGLYSSNMGNATYGGVNYNSGTANGSKYSVISEDRNHPVNFESWYSAIRFANWLDNGQAPGSTETGAYTLIGGTPTPSNATSITRNAGATIFLPSENEWYKAAYYNPASSSYYKHATSSNTAPTATGPTATPNSANYNDAVGHLTDVGAYSGTTSPFGAFDMGGNVNQWNETLVESLSNGTYPRVQGGSFVGDFSLLQSSDLYSHYDPRGDESVGFRVASVPEPGTAVLAIVAFGLMWVLRKRFK